jgi:hypothetical protein
MDDVPLEELAKAMRVLMILARDWEAKRFWIAAQALDAVTCVLTCPRISLDMFVRR